MRNQSMPYPCLIPCSMEISRKFHAHFPQTYIKNALRNLCRILPQFMRNLSMPYPCLILCSMQISGKFHADFSRLPCWMRCIIFAESFRNPFEMYLCLIHAWFHAASHATLRRFHADFYAECVAESLRNPCGVFAESLRNPCGIHAKSIYALYMLDPMRHEDSRRLACRMPRRTLRNPCRIFAKS